MIPLFKYVAASLVLAIVGCHTSRVFDIPTHLVAPQVRRMYTAVERHSHWSANEAAIDGSDGLVIPQLHGDGVWIDILEEEAPGELRLRVRHMRSKPWCIDSTIRVRPVNNDQTRVTIRSIDHGDPFLLLIPQRDREYERMRIDEIGLQLGVVSQTK